MSLPNPCPSILDTDTKLNRYWNMRSIVESATNSVVAEILGKQTSQISQFCGKNPKRAIGDRLVGQIEQAFMLTPGSLDKPPSSHIGNDDETISEIAVLLSAASDLDKMLVAQVARAICGHSSAIVRKMSSSESAHALRAEHLRELIKSGSDE